MIGNVVLSNTDNMVLFSPSEGKAVALALGDIISADVLDIIESGMVTLRITPPVGKALDLQGGTLLAYTNVPMSEGDRIDLQVVGTGSEVRLRFLGVESKPEGETTDPANARIQQTVNKLSDARIDTSDFKSLKDMLSAIPERVKNTFPEFGRLEQIMPDIKNMSVSALKSNIEDSGILFETRLKEAALGDGMDIKGMVGEAVRKAIEGQESLDLNEQLNSTLDAFIKKADGILKSGAESDMKALIMELRAVMDEGGKQVKNLNERELIAVIKQRLDEALSSGDKAALLREKPEISNDQKALLLKAKDVVEQERIGQLLRQSGASKDEITNTIDKFIRNIEHYQINSRANETIYTFLPFSWPEMKDGQLLFKKNKYNAKKSFSCDINLDLGNMGKLSISTTVSEGSFFLSFYAQKKETMELIADNKAELESRFLAAGLPLKVINVGQKSKLNINESLKEKGLSLKV
ncbi:MAG: flagellar hook-length control protein FliK [Nitrospirae bacterium YQR-1]